jgi:iron complex outermembrane recepter protein
MPGGGIPMRIRKSGTASRSAPTVAALLAAAMTPLFAPEAAAAADIEGAPGDLDPIIVEARKRAEALHAVPISVTAITGGELDLRQIRDLSEVAAITPNLTSSSAGLLGTNEFSIRGIYSPVGSPTVSLQFNDAPFHIRGTGFAGAASPYLWDIEQVEVLRGPQGTLFGGSSIGGTVRIVSRKPDLLKHDASARATMTAVTGGGLGMGIEAAGGGPVATGKAAVRLGAAYRQIPGFIDKVDAQGKVVARNIDDARMTAAKASATARLQTVRITPSVHYQRTWTDEVPLFQSGPRFAEQAFINSQPSDDNFLLGSLSAEAATDWGELTSVTSILTRRDRRTSDYSTVFSELVLGGVPGLVPPGGTRSLTSIEQSNFTQELRLSGDVRRNIKFVAGLFWHRAGLDLGQDVFEPGVEDLVQDLLGLSVEEVFGAPLLPGGVTYQGRESIIEREVAAFGELSWRLLTNLELSAGMRVSRSALDLQVASYGPYAGPPSPFNTPPLQRQNETPVTPRFALSYSPERDLLFYASSSRGFRAGGANTPVPVDPCSHDLRSMGLDQAPTFFGSDHVWSHELGAKASLLGGRLKANVAGFNTEWHNIQEAITLPNCGFTFIDNLGRGRSRGFEVELSLKPVAKLQLMAALGHVAATFRETVTGAGGDLSPPVVIRGDRLPFTPDWSVSLAGDYRDRIRGTMLGYVRAEFQHSSAYRRTPGEPAVGYNPLIYFGDARENVRLQVGLEDTPWSVAVFVDNLFNDRSILFNSADLVPVTGFPLRQTSVRPRMAGLVAGCSF